MRREQLLVGMLVALLTATLVAVAFVPQAVASHDEPVREGDIDIEEIQITTNSVGGETVAVSADARLGHRGGVSRNVTVEFRAIDLETGMLATAETVDVGSLRGDRETAVRSNLSVERSGDYQMEAIVYRDQQRIAVGHREIRGTDSLTPAYAESPVEFHRFSGQNLPVIEYSIDDATGNRTELAVSGYLTNTGDTPSEDLRLTLTARQIDSNVVADRAEIQVEQIDAGQTVTPGTTLTVPENYNYYLDAILWKEGVIIGTARSAAQLDPTQTIPENSTTRESDFAAGDFVSDGGQTRDTPTPDGSFDSGDGPGFGAGTVLIALLALVVAITRRNND
jgi:PGF-CTERM protein